MSSLYLLRHGQAVFGADDYDQLSPRGQQQARATGAFLAARGMAFDRMLVGPRQRHEASADALLVAMPRLAQRLRRRREPALDEFAEGHVLLAAARQRQEARQQSWPDERKAQLRLYVEEVRRWSDGEELPGCVPIEAFHTRVTSWLDTLVREKRSGQRLLAVTSAGTIAVLLGHVLGLPRQRIGDLLLALDNAALSELVFSAGRVSLRSFNSTSHLPAELTSRI